MVVWTLPAKNDLRQIYNSIAYDSKIYAKRVTQNIAAKPDVLDGLPRIGKVVDELKDDNIRELPFTPTALFMKLKQTMFLFYPWYINDRICNQRILKAECNFFNRV